MYSLAFIAIHFGVNPTLPRNDDPRWDPPVNEFIRVEEEKMSSSEVASSAANGVMKAMAAAPVIYSTGKKIYKRGKRIVRAIGGISGAKKRIADAVKNPENRKGIASAAMGRLAEKAKSSSRASALHKAGMLVGSAAPGVSEIHKNISKVKSNAVKGVYREAVKRKVAEGVKDAIHASRGGMLPMKVNSLVNRLHPGEAPLLAGPLSSATGPSSQK